MSSSAPLRVLVTGANGRVGRLLCELVEHAPDLALAQGARRGEALRGGADVVVDFTSPDATAAYAAWCAQHGVSLVTGTTGLDEHHHEALARASERVAVLASPNMSLGVNLLFDLAERAARALGESVDLEVVEAHHRHKKDAPSGTAKRLVEVLARGRGWLRDGQRPDAVLAPERRGWTGERAATSIGVHAVRGGDVVGEHTALFLGSGERLELTHRATDRAVFARGALVAARWLAGRPAGLYSMSDVLFST